MNRIRQEVVVRQDATKNARKYAYLLGILLLILSAQVIRLGLMTYRQCIETDGVTYVSIAHQLIHNGTLTNRFYPPLYPALMGLVSLAIEDYELAGRIVSVSLGSLLIVPVFMLCSRVYSRKVAFLTSVLIIFYPTLADYSVQVSTESSFAFFLQFFFLVTILAFKTHRWIFFFIAGILLGLSYLIRPESLGYLPYTVVAYSLVFRFFERTVSKARVAANTGFFVGAAVLVMLPYMIFVGGMSGKTQYQLAVYGESTLRSDFSRAVDEAHERYSKAEAPSLPAEFSKHPNLPQKVSLRLRLRTILFGEPRKLYFFSKNTISYTIKMSKRWIMNLHLVQKYVVPGLFPPLILVLVTLGLIRMKGRWEEKYLSLLWLPYLAVFFFLVDIRFFLPLVPVALVFAARGIEVVQDAFSNRFGFAKSPIFQSLLPIIVVAGLLPYTLRPLYHPDESITHREAGEWLREHVQTPMRIMDRKPWVAFYARAEHVRLPVGEWDEIARYARTQGVTHLIIDNKMIAQVRQELLFLVRGDNLPNELRLVKQFQSPGTAKVLVYEFR